MSARSKVVSFSESKFELRRLPPEVGSFIFMRMLGVSMRTASDAADREAVKPKHKHAEQAVAEAEPTKTSGEMQVRALSFAVMSGSIGFDDFKFIQSACMKVVSRVEVRAGAEFPMPVMNDVGEWADEDLAADVGMVMRLTTEVLIFCFADFFESGGLSS